LFKCLLFIGFVANVCAKRFVSETRSSDIQRDAVFLASALTSVSCGENGGISSIHGLKTNGDAAVVYD
jgi:hypothetical protein